MQYSLTSFPLGLPAQPWPEPAEVDHDEIAAWLADNCKTFSLLTSRAEAGRWAEAFERRGVSVQTKELR